MHPSRRGSLVFLTSSVAWTPGWTVASQLSPADAQVAQAYLLGRLLVFAAPTSLPSWHFIFIQPFGSWLRSQITRPRVSRGASPV